MFKDFGTATINQITKKMLNDCSLKIPSLSEQTKIADFLSIVDVKIQNQQDKITHLENIKKGFMQKIFSRKIRFKDDQGNEFPEWEDKKFLNMTQFITANAIDSKENGKYIIMDMGSINKDGFILNHKKTDINTPLLNKGDLVMPKDDIGSGLIICKTAYINDNNKYVLGDHVYKLNFTQENNLYMHYYINSSLIQSTLHQFVTGTAIKGVKYKDFKNVVFNIPCLEEQQKIANFLSSFDEKIEVEKNTLEHLKELKKGLLQQMFI